MTRQLTGKIELLILALVSVFILGAGVWIAYDNLRSYNIAIAAGSAKSEGHQLMQALRTVAARHYPRLKIVVHETGGTPESIERLTNGRAQLAAVEGDLPEGSSARSVAVLFDDDFQLLAHKDSAIAQFSDLKGKRIALPKNGDQLRSFVFVAGHYGLKESDFTFVGGNDDLAMSAFAKGEADAIFRVRAIPNAGIAQLANAGNSNFLPIDAAKALHIVSPVYLAVTIPKGLYVGNPPVPADDLPTVAIQQVLLARSDVDEKPIFWISQILMEHRQELASAVSGSERILLPVVSQIAQPAVQTALGAALHPGAISYYNHEQSTFISRHADLLVFVLVALILLALWASKLGRSTALAQATYATAHNQKIVALIEEAQASQSDGELTPIYAELMSMLTQAIRDLDEGRLSESSFQSFRTIWQVAIDLVRDRRAASTVVEPDAVDVESPTRWSLAKFLQTRSGQ